MAKPRVLKATLTGDLPEISPEEFKKHVGQVTLIDVRGRDEFDGELSHIPGARLVTLGPELDEFLRDHDKNDEIVFVCRSGGRSGRATRQSRQLGFLNSVNLQGGMLLWNERNYPVDRQTRSS